MTARIASPGNASGPPVIVSPRCFRCSMTPLPLPHHPVSSRWPPSPPEDHPLRHFAPPPFQARLQCSQLSVAVDAGLLRLQPLKQFARRTPRLGLEPAVRDQVRLNEPWRRVAPVGERAHQYAAPDSGHRWASPSMFQLPEVLTEAEVVEAEAELKALRCHALAVGSRDAKIFVAVLGASNYTYAEARFNEAMPDWISQAVEHRRGSN